MILLMKKPKLPKSTSIDDSIKNLRKLEKLFHPMMFNGAGDYWNQLVKAEYDFLVSQCEKFIIQCFRASTKYNKHFVSEITFRSLQFRIYDRDGDLSLYSSFSNDEYVYFTLDYFLAKNDPFEDEASKTSSNFNDYSCVLLVKSFTCLKEYFDKLEEHSN